MPVEETKNGVGTVSEFPHLGIAIKKGFDISTRWIVEGGETELKKLFKISWCTAMFKMENTLKNIGHKFYKTLQGITGL